MQPFQVDQSDQPLMGSWTPSGYQDMDGAGAGRSWWVVQPIVERWHSLSPQRRTWAKRAAIVVGFVTAFALIIALGAKAAAKQSGNETGAGTPGPPSPPPPRVVDPIDQLCEWEDLYLPETVVPVRYNLNLDVYFQPNSSSPIPLAEEGNSTPRVHGSVTAYVRVLQPTRCIVLHADARLAILSASFASGPGGSVIDEDLGNEEGGGSIRVHRPDAGQVILRFASVLPAVPGAAAGQPLSESGAVDEASLAQLTIEFSYDLLPGLDGFYLSTYAADGVNHTIAATQFESVSARKAFPCFDEPRLKARFDLTINTIPDVAVLSNMPMIEDGVTVEPAEGLEAHQFIVSPPMSTYLMAWVVGELGHVSASCQTDTGAGGKGAQKSVPVSIYAVPSRVGQLGTALGAACVSLQTFTATLGVPYTLPKLDLVALPEFAAGAMENWGIITYRETSLVIDPQQSDIQQALRVNITVAHEISHQWFGNLVTCADWPELWLNEGFASYFEYVGADATSPELGYFKHRFFPGDTLPAMVADTFASSHPLSSPGHVTTLSQIDNYFDYISYEKGGAVLRMLRAYMTLALDHGAPFLAASSGQRAPVLRAAPAGAVADMEPFTGDTVVSMPLRRARRILQNGAGPYNAATVPRPTWRTETFFAALKAYLERFAFQATTYKELWLSMDEATGLPIGGWMRSWTVEPNFPVLRLDDQVVRLNTSDPTRYTAVLTLSQAPVVPGRTCGDPDPEAPGGPAMRWWLPIMLSILDSTEETSTMQVVVLDRCSATVEVDVGSNLSPTILLNAGRFGFFRVNYSQPAWAAVISRHFNPALTSAADFAGSLADSYRLMEAGLLGAGQFVTLATGTGYRAQQEYMPWAVLSSKLARLRRLLDFAAGSGHGAAADAWSDCRDNLNDWVASKITGPVVAGGTLGWTVRPSDTAEARETRQLVLGAAGDAGDKSVLSQAEKMMKPIWKAVADSKPPDFSAIHPDLRGLVYCLALQATDKAKTLQRDYDRTKAAYLQATDPEERWRLLSSLTCGEESKLHKDYLMLLTTPDVRLQDVGRALEVLAAQSWSGFKAVWDFLLQEDSMAALLARWPSLSSASYSLGLSIKEVAGLWTDTSRRDDMAAFVQRYAAMLDPAFMTYYTEAAEQNAAWLAASGTQLCAQLQSLGRR